ncbi:3555_t:CDS:1, partial [Funneliformis mosseae]
LTDDDLVKLFLYYDKRKERLTQIFKQEVIVTKVKDIKNAEHIFKKCLSQSEVAESFNTTITTNITTIIKSWYVLTEAEKAILKPYFENQDPSNKETEVVLDLFLKLLSDYWIRQKVRNA